MQIRLKYLIIFIFILSIGSFFYIKKRKDPFIAIPLYKMKHSDFYFLNIEIENHSIPVLLDTGLSSSFSLRRHFLDEFKNKTKEEGVYPSTDINGNKYKDTHYIVDLINLTKDIEIKASVKQENINFLMYGGKIVNPTLSKTLKKPHNFSSKQEQIEKKMGRIGSKVFKELDYWCFDFPNSKIYYLGKWKESLKKLHISLGEFTELALIKNKSHIVIPLDTDFGRKTFILDTAASATIMRCPSDQHLEHQIVTSKKFSANGHNMGEKRIYLFNFPDKFLVDGFLGMDFLKDRVILLDFKNQKIFIGPKEK